ncbi:MAG: hypothetical protein GC192_12455 [Bacteroidetes bacterium]|nr:hypothetical protein [Bacteroidota bacterium]
MLNRIFPIILLVAILGSCNNSNNNAGSAKIPDNIGGYWVNATWWQELQNTKSPMKAAEKTGDVAAAIFHHEDSTRWLVDLSYGWHEGQQLTLRTKDGGLQVYDPMNATVHQYNLVPQSDGSIHLDDTPMVRLGDAYTGFNVIAHTLVGGQYDLDGKTVVFNPKGTVVGLDDYYRYELLLDYVAEDVPADQLMLSKEGRTPEFYAFKIEGNHLLLYEIDDMGGKEEFKYEVGKLKYDLVKK